VTYRFTLNGEEVALDVPGMRRLLDALREDLRLTGTKEGCGEGECGACSVLVDGQVVDSCLVPVCQVEGAEVRTVEGLAPAGQLDALQQAFLETGGAQCGICTPGLILAAMPLEAGASLDAIKTALAGNLCRCTGYPAIFRSVEAALKPPAFANRLRRGKRLKVKRADAR
jgi:aerobic-type carbon monoxide dehydrogenase small subunit (CoxS/CutS family)